MSIGDEYKKMISGIVPEDGSFVPLLRWASGSIYNIEATQKINFNFKYVDKCILLKQLVLNNKVKHFMKFPSASKEESDIEFFYEDICRFFGWTRNELRKSTYLLDMRKLAETIAVHYAYDNKQRKSIGLIDLGCFKDVEQKTKSRGVLKERGNDRARVQSDIKRSKNSEERSSKITDFEQAL
jgi:hypothetical protein